MPDDTKPETPSSEITEEKPELKPEDLEKVSGGLLTITPTVTAGLTRVPLSITTPLPDAAVL